MNKLAAQLNKSQILQQRLQEFVRKLGEEIGDQAVSAMFVVHFQKSVEFAAMLPKASSDVHNRLIDSMATEVVGSVIKLKASLNEPKFE